MNPIEKFKGDIPTIEAKLGYTFKDKELLTLAFVHRSFVNENRELVAGHNERLEFLGDSVLGLLIAEHLYREEPGTAEGQLSASRSRLVQASSCARYIEQLGVGEYLLLGRGEQISGGRGRESIEADLFEAIIGAIYLDSDIDQTRTFLFDACGEAFSLLLDEPGENWKAQLQDYTQKTYQLTPTYRVIEESGPDHSKNFVVGVFVEEAELGMGTGASKKEAQQAAAGDAIAKLEGKDA